MEKTKLQAEEAKPQVEEVKTSGYVECGLKTIWDDMGDTMNIFSGVTQFHISERTAVTLGKFDGIHKGHMALIDAAAAIAKEKGLKLAVFTFDVLPVPGQIGTQTPQITTNAEKRIIFSDIGVDYLVEYPFDEATASMEPLDFIGKVISGCLNAEYVIVGEDWHFGKDRTGNCDTLLAARKLFNYEVEMVKKEVLEQKDISSTWIRQEICVGNMENVNILLGYPYMIMGTVEEGKHIGEDMGFATVNIYPSGEKLLPPKGVYASKVVLDGERYYGITNIGVRPTLDDGGTLSIETHIFDYSGDLYGRQIIVELFHFERPEIKFDTLEKLTAQVKADMEFTRTFFMI